VYAFAEIVAGMMDEDTRAWLPPGYDLAHFDPAAVSFDDPARRLAFSWYGNPDAGLLIRACMITVLLVSLLNRDADHPGFDRDRANPRAFHASRPACHIGSFSFVTPMTEHNEGM
jgi:hypothetical protein